MPEPATTTLEDSRIGPETLDAEWTRVAMMLLCAEALRTGERLDPEISEQFEALCTEVEEARTAGAWAGLSNHVAGSVLNTLIRLDIDILAVCVAPLARPVLAPRMHSLQPHTATSWPSLPLVQELLMLGDGEEMALLFSRLAADAPLVQGGLIHIEGIPPPARPCAPPRGSRARCWAATPRSRRRRGPVSAIRGVPGTS